MGFCNITKPDLDKILACVIPEGLQERASVFAWGRQQSNHNEWGIILHLSLYNAHHALIYHGSFWSLYKMADGWGQEERIKMKEKSLQAKFICEPYH